MKFSLIKYNDFSGPLNFAIDEALTEYVSRNPDNFFIRLFGFKEPGVVSLAYMQSPEDSPEEVRKAFGIPCVRRQTGGRALFHDPSDPNYTVVTSRSYFPNYLDAYYEICLAIVDTLSEIGITGVEYNKSTTILVNGRKISGSAQNLRSSPVLLQHGSIFYNHVPEKRVLLTGGSEHDLGKVTAILEHADASREDFFEIFAEKLLEGKQTEEIELPDEILERAEGLARTKYETEEWNNSGRLRRGSCATRWGTYPSRKNPR